MVSQRQKNAGQHQLKNGTVQHSFRFLACGSRLHFSSIPPGHHWESGLHTPADYFSGEAMDSFCFPKNTKNPNPSPIGKSSDFVVLVHLQDSNPGPTDQEKPMCNNRQFSELRQFVVFSVLSWFYVLHSLHYPHMLFRFASVIQLFRCAKSVQKYAEPKSAP